jgi:CheY-like chemotaxis protein
MIGGASTPTGAGRNLVATPDSVAADVLRRTLGPLRFEVLAAHSGSCAIELAARCRPDVVVADIELGGPTTDLRFAKTLEERAGASIILLTDRHDAQTVAAIAAFGRCGVLRKPSIRDSSSSRSCWPWNGAPTWAPAWRRPSCRPGHAPREAASDALRCPPSDAEEQLPLVHPEQQEPVDRQDGDALHQGLE